LAANPLHNERETLKQVAEGDEAAFAIVYEHYVPVLTPFLRRMLHSETMVKEVIQLTFIRFWLSRDKLTGIKDPKAWIFRLATNTCYTYFKQLLLQQNLAKNAASNMTPVRDNVSESMHARDLQLAVAEAVSRLSHQRKKIYRLSREQGLTIPEIAKQTGLSSTTVKNTLSSSLAAIRKYLQHRGWQFSLITIVLEVL
jgi:RNA polymerase sigma factor (sigma-70 family)